MRFVRPAAAALGVAAAALGIDALAMWGLGEADAGLRVPRHLFQLALTPAVLAVHGSASALGGWWLWRSTERFAWAPGVGLVAILVAVLGPAGAVVACMAAAMGWALPDSHERRSAPRHDDTERPRPAAMRGPAPVATDEAESLCDVFRTGTLAQRRRAVALIAANFKPQFAPALHMALQDSHGAIRVQAGLALQQLEDELDRQQRRLEADGEVEWTTHGFGSRGVHLELARLHDLVAYSGLLDPERSKAAQLRALEAYKRHLVRHPDDEEVVAVVGRLFIRAEQHQLVADWFTELVAAGTINDSILTWLAEALYRSRRFGELRDLLRQHGPRLHAHLPPESPLRGALQLWQAVGSADTPQSLNAART